MTLLDGLDPPSPTTDDVLGMLCDVVSRHGTLTVALAEPARIGDRCGVVDRVNAIVLLNAGHKHGKRRATLLHELLHLACPDCDDDEVEDRTAATLVPLRDAAAVARGVEDPEKVARRLDVDPQLVRQRVSGLAVVHGGGDQVG